MQLHSFACYHPVAVHRLLKRPFFPPLTCLGPPCQNQLTIDVRVYLWIFNSIPVRHLGKLRVKSNNDRPCEWDLPGNYKTSQIFAVLWKLSSALPPLVAARMLVSIVSVGCWVCGWGYRGYCWAGAGWRLGIGQVKML